jgi:hypothetical protein
MQQQQILLILFPMIKIELRFYQIHLNLQIDLENQLTNPFERTKKMKNYFKISIPTRCGMRYSFDEANTSFSGADCKSLKRLWFDWWYLNKFDYFIEQKKNKSNFTGKKDS